MKIILGEKLFDYDEVGKLFGVSKASVSNYVKRYNLNPTLIKRRKYLTERDIKKILIPNKED